MNIDRCLKSDLPIGECADSCCRPDLAHIQVTPEVWMRNAEAAPTRQHTSRLAQAKATQPLHHAPSPGIEYEIVDMVRELCEPTTHREPYHLHATGRTRHHATTSPPLLNQLGDAITPSGSAEAGVLRPSASKPAARLDAIDTAARIEIDASRWLRLLGSDDVAPDVIALVRRIASLLPSIQRCHSHKPTRDPKTKQIICCDAHRIEHDINRWWIWCRVVTGWDRPAWQPNNTCPLCGTRGTLRVRPVDQLAKCINDPCSETWDHTTFGLLVEHIRTENHEDEEAS